MTGRIAACIWYDGAAEEAATFYAETFPDSHVGSVHPPIRRWPGAGWKR